MEKVENINSDISTLARNNQKIKYNFNFNNYLGFSFFKIFLKKVWSFKNFLITAIFISIIFITTITLLPTKYYFSLVMVIGFFIVVAILYSQIFFTFRSTHYYKSLKSEAKFFNLKIYVNMLLNIFIYCFFVFLVLFFLSGFFSFANWGLEYGTYTKYAFTCNFNWTSWNWIMISYQFIIIIVLSFAICLFCQELFASKKNFNIFVIFAVVYITFNIIITSFGFYIWENDAYSYYEQNSNFVNNVAFITFRDPGIYFDSSSNTLYFYPQIENEIFFLQKFSLITNPFYSCGMFISLATSAPVFNEEYWLSLGGTLDDLIIVINGEYIVAYEDLNIAMDFSTYDGLNYPNTSYLFIFWLPYIWIAILVSLSFALKKVKPEFAVV